MLLDAVIGHQLVDATLEDELQRCDREALAAYEDVVRSLRAPPSSAAPSGRSSAAEAIVDELVGPEGCADELLRLEILEDVERLAAELADDLAALEREFLRLAAQDDAAGSLAAARSATGGWAPADDERFLVVLRAFGAKPPAVLYGQLAAVLPHVDAAAARRHVKFHQHRRFWLDKTRDRQRDHERRLERLKAAARERLAARRQLEAERAQQLARLEQMRAQCAERHERVAELRGARDAERRIRQQQQEIEALVASEEREAAARRWRQRHEQQRRRVDEYRHDKLLDALADARREDEQREREERERAALSAVNAERVQFRQSELQRKMEHERLELAKEMEAEALRLARLESIKQAAPYAERIAAIAPDPERTRQETVAFRANAEAAGQELPVHEAGLFPTHGYDTETLFKNARFRLGIALRDAGLQSSELARRALADVKVRNAGAYRHHQCAAARHGLLRAVLPLLALGATRKHLLRLRPQRGLHGLDLRLRVESRPRRRRRLERVGGRVRARVAPARRAVEPPHAVHLQPAKRLGALGVGFGFGFARARRQQRAQLRAPGLQSLELLARAVECELRRRCPMIMRETAPRSVWIVLWTLWMRPSATAATGAVATPYDANFACCGGCSSFKRADAYNSKLATGSYIFIWDASLKTDPAPTCRLTFPYDPSLKEQVGDRRVRSGRLVGTSYPIDHDFDHLCCEQRGECRALQEDASGRCLCVKRWGFTGDHCELSIYDVANANNTAHFPAITNLSDVDSLLPEPRAFLLSFDFAAAIASQQDIVDPAAVEGDLLDALSTGSYRQFAWATCAYAVAGIAVLVLFYVVHVTWTFCCFRCGCRKRDPRKQAKIYSKATKIFWGVLMCLFVAITTAASATALLKVHNDVLPRVDSVVDTLETSLPQSTERFCSRLLDPITSLLATGDPVSGLALRDLQRRALDDMAPHSFLDRQSPARDAVGERVFQLLDALEARSSLFPTGMNASLDCSSLDITQSIVGRMTAGSTTGCFRCKACSLIGGMLEAAKDRWRRLAFKSQLDLAASREQLQSLGRDANVLVPDIQRFRDRVNASCSLLLQRTRVISESVDRLQTEARQVVVFGLLGLSALCLLTFVLATLAVGVGVTTNKRPAARATCFFGQITSLVALFLTGALYSAVLMAHDGIVGLQLLDQNMTIFVGPALARDDIAAMLADRNLVDETQTSATLAFADTLHVPPHPTPYDDDPARIDVQDIYDLPELFALAESARDLPAARASFFGWDEPFLAAQYANLYVWAFGNDSVVSPYNLTVHQTLLNSTTTVLMDPDSDSLLVTDDDLQYVRTVFNQTWRGVDDRGVAQNDLIATQWRVVARLELQKRRLGQYLTAIADIIESTRPLLGELIANTTRMEDDEFQLKAPVEFFTDTIRRSRISDCSFNANCAWFRDALNRMFADLQDVIRHSEIAALSAAVCVVAAVLGVICAGCFASRLRRNIVKVYSAN
ncbi:hypothetical protein ATCC90586_009831 [Pythium insidiosum]|nr:hypothetical protein ATCC90586_009831 [Pythium insidiosum]